MSLVGRRSNRRDQLRIGGDKNYKVVVQGLVAIAVWCIWKARNGKMFDNGKDDSEESFGELRSLGFFWLNCRSKHRN
ncbi:hypothetical protein Hanom_Chr09g00783131 [Helianthus anomalus]